DVADRDGSLDEDIAVACDYAHTARLGHLEGLDVRAVLLGLLSHQPDVWHATHGARIEGAVGFAVVDHRLVDAGVRTVGNHELGVAGVAVGAPHLAGVTDCGRHRSIDDHV